MSEQELNSYRFVSGDEPGDERLCQIMREVTAEAMKRQANTDSRIRKEVDRQREALRKRWNLKINAAING